MKKIGFLLILCILMLLSFKQDDPKVKVDIPDNNFLIALIENGFDTDGDSIISKAEAVTSLSLVDLGIADMTGIEAFVNLKVLACPDNLFVCRQLKVDQMPDYQ